MLRTEDQAWAFRVVLQTPVYLCGFGINYFDLENVGYVKTATEVSADNSALMRNIRRHEHALEGAIAGICRALMAAERRLGVELPDEGLVRVTFDDSIITDTTAEKHQSIDEVAAGLMAGWEYRAKWYGENEEVARNRVDGYHSGNGPIPRRPATGRASGPDGEARPDGNDGTRLRLLLPRVPAAWRKTAGCNARMVRNRSGIRIHAGTWRLRGRPTPLAPRIAPSCARGTGDERVPHPTITRG